MTLNIIIQRFTQSFFLVLFISFTALLDIHSQNDFNLNAIKDSLSLNKENKKKIITVLMDSLLKTTEANDANPILDVLLDFNDDEVLKLLLYDVDFQTDKEPKNCIYPISDKLQEKVDKLILLSIVLNSDFLERFDVSYRNPNWIVKQDNLDILISCLGNIYDIIDYKQIYNMTKDNTNKKKNLELLIKKLKTKYK